MRLNALVRLCGSCLLTVSALGTSQELIAAIRTQAPAVQRTVVHTEAYKKRDNLGPHLEIKITPPEGRGHQGFLLVEVYNYSKANLAGADFWLSMSNQWGDSVDAHVECDDIKGGYSALKWIKVPGNKPLPEITLVNVKNMKMFTDHAHELKMKYTTDLIKK